MLVAFAFADIRGNCIADELAKVAAEEAKNYPEDSQILTCADFKKYAKLSCHIKWQSVGRYQIVVGICIISGQWFL